MANNNSFTLSTSEQDIVLSQAILIYSYANRSGYNPGDTAYATKHKVRNFGTKTNPDIQIAPGESITLEGLTAMFSAMAKRLFLNVEIIPENVLSVSGDHLVWWLPAGMKTVFFNTKELGKRGANVPHPSLLFAVVKRQWFVFALKDDVRPGAGTNLHFAPYFNVGDAGHICAGSAQTPDGISVSDTATWESAFFDSEFTHPNGSKKKCSHPRGEYAMWKELLDGQYVTFPKEYLVPNGSTLESFISTVRSTLKGA